MSSGFVADTPAPSGGFTPDSPTPPPGGGGFTPDNAPPSTSPTPAPQPGAPPAKKPFWTAEAKTLAKNVSGAEDSVRRNWQWAQAHPIDEVFLALGAGQRAVGNVVGGMEQHPHGVQLVDGLKSLAKDVFHPGDLIHGRDATARDTDSIRELLHAPTHETIDSFVSTHVPKDLQPYASAILKGGEDMSLQTASDPVTYAGGLGAGERAVKIAGALKMALKGSGAAKALAALAHSQDALHLFPWLPKLDAAYGKMAVGINNALVQGAEGGASIWHALTGVRPELDKIAGEDGRAAIIQIENRNRQLAKADRTADEAAVATGHAPTMSQRYLQYLHQAATTVEEQTELARLGSGLPVTATKIGFDPAQAVRDGIAAMRKAGKTPTAADMARFASQAQAQFTANLTRRFQNGLAAFAAGTPEEIAQKLEQMRGRLQNSRTAAEAVEHLNQFGGWKPGVSMDAAGLRKYLDQNSRTLEQALKSVPGGKALVAATSIPRGLMQAALFLNPLPHGIKNVGQLAYLAGGFPAVIKGIKYMAGSVVGQGVPDLLRQRLAKIGASSNIGEGLRDTVWSGIPGWNAVAGKFQDAMSHMEESWRAGLLETLDKKLGKSSNAADELMKGHMVNNALGDYHNQSAFVQAFALMGGPWVAFRLGIIPREVMETLKNHPERVLAFARAQSDLQRNRSKKAQADNELQFGGPIDDFSKMVTNPVGYAESPASTGMIGKALGAAGQIGHESAFQTAGSLVQSVNPVGEVGDIAQHAIQGTGAPAPNGPHGTQRFQPQTLTDRLINATMETLAIYYSKNKSKAELQREDRENRSIEHKERQDIEKRLGVPGGSAPQQAAPSGFTPDETPP